MSMSFFFPFPNDRGAPIFLLKIKANKRLNNEHNYFKLFKFFFTYQQRKLSLAIIAVTVN